MKRGNLKYFYASLCMLAAFVLWTVGVSFIDTEQIGPQGSTVGLAAINSFFHNLTGVHMSLYTVTDWLGLVPLGFIVGFAVLGLVQWVQRKKLLAVDRSILFLGGFYLAVMTAYLFFERFVVNYRPVLIDGILEASYPSSTTMLAMCVMPTALMQLHTRIKNISVKRWVEILLVAFTVFMVIGRLISGVHWFSDIVGGALLSGGLVMLYYTLSQK